MINAKPTSLDRLRGPSYPCLGRIQIPSAPSPNAVHSYTPGGKTPSAQGECPESKSNAPRPRPFHQQISFQWSPIASDSRLSAAKAQGSWTGVARTAARDSTQTTQQCKQDPLALSQRMILAHIDKDSSIKQRDRAAFTRLVEQRR